MVRDELYLTPTDPLEETLDRRFLDETTDDHGEAKASKEARQRLESKLAEVIVLKKQLAKLHAELEGREAEAAKEPESMALAAQPAARDIEPVVSQLRRKLASVKTELKQRHLERNQLRQELQGAHEDLRTLRDRKAKSAVTNEEKQDEEEESVLLPEEKFLGAQPLRIPSYPKRFSESLEAVPEPVAREAIRLIGRLAAGDAAAFRGSKRLKVRHEVLRQRVGQRHRILFRLDGETLEVLALIHRRDLERYIKRLD